MKNIAFSVICLTLLLAACRKDIDEFVPYGSSATELEQLLGEIPNPNTETVFSFTGGIPDTFLETASGVRLKIIDADFLFENEDGIAVPASTCLDLQIHVKEYIKHGDIVAAGIPLTLNGTQPEDLSGLVQLEVFCGNSPLEIVDGKFIDVDIPSNSTAPPNGIADLDMYFASRDVNGNIIAWEPNSDLIYFGDWADNSGNPRKGFEFEVTKTGLFGGFKFPASTLGRICTDIPAYYNADNTLAFLFFTDGKSALPMGYDSQNKNFCIEGIPLGFPAKVVMISKLGDQWQYSEEAIQTTADLTVQMTQLNTDRQAVLDSMRSF